MEKGHFWINEKSLVRYWPSYLSAKTSCNVVCGYRGAYSQNKFLTNYEKPTQP
jgi:hypothetical protein